MASWDDLVSYVRVRYEIMRSTDTELWFNLPTTGERTQLVVVRSITGADGEPGAQIASPVGKLTDLDLPHLLAAAGEQAVGGVVAQDGVVVFRHAIPLHEGELAAFDGPFQHVVHVADELEELLTGGDEH
ncbi:MULTISPECIES: hypothetical protein [Pseudonocardia]|uniref:Sensory transduction regulator n=1 Tax=Pseudonocardia oroxyli TaxID=366584 RepID=A0A1G7PI98_PSEOR|nr:MULTISPECIES: hypothetical protein [Pseudonocardia]MCF7552487.1 hypothetical protein [Pseudonocardia sp. WMMC193]SDF85961.1 hypothetical protein SAMN05216377_107131 [Pseudonocardia oroxyli]